MDYLKYAKDYGFSDRVIAHRFGMTESEVYQLRQDNNIKPVYKMVDTCAASLNQQRHTTMEHMKLKMSQL